jgi:hypothetical protein
MPPGPTADSTMPSKKLIHERNKEKDHGTV